MLYRSRRIFCLLGNDADEQIAQANVEVRLASQIDKASAIRGKPIEPLGEKRSRLVHHSAPQKHRDHVKLESQMVGAIGELGRNAEPQLLRERGHVAGGSAQDIYFVEFDGLKIRKYTVQIMGE